MKEPQVVIRSKQPSYSVCPACETPALLASRKRRTFRRIIFSGLLLTCATVVFAQPGQYQQLPQQTIESRLEQYLGSDYVREATIKKLFQEAGCAIERIREQPVPHSQAPNVSCTLPGTGDGVLIVGAHFDHVTAGDGVVDNWSGAALLPSLYESLASKPRLHTFVFISFAAEEKGFVGSRTYVQDLPAELVAHIQGMINLDTLGLGPTEVWVSNSDPTLVKDLFAVATAMKLPASTMNVDGIGDSDGHSFKAKNVPVITLHSVTTDTLSILHSDRDRLSAVKFGDYYDSYRLIAAYLATLDSELVGSTHTPGEGISNQQK